MKILTIEEASLGNSFFDNLKLGNPDYVDDYVYSNVLYGKEVFYIQTPKMYSLMENKGEITLVFQNKDNLESLKNFYKLFRKIENRVCELISSASEKWFPNKLSFKHVSTLFRSSLELPSDLNLPFRITAKLNNDCECYKSKTRVDISSIKEDTEIVSLILPSEVIITTTSSYIIWEIAQIKVNQPAKKQLRGYGFRLDVETPRSNSVQKEQVTPPVEVVSESKKTKPTESITVNLIEEPDNISDNVSEY